jgi:uncharacterized protein with HEPN domain
MDKSEIIELLHFILESISIVKNRFNYISSVDDFIENDEGLMRLDAISMRLQSIGEAIKNIDKKDKQLLLSVASKEYWSKIIKTREIISHHYINLDAEIVFYICKNELEKLEIYIKELKKKVKQ